MILLDTDVCLLFLKGNKKIIDMFGGQTEEVFVSAITAQELFYAANRSSDPIANRITVEKFLLTIRILHPDLDVIKFASFTQVKERKQGRQSCLSDILIYSLSKTKSMKLITTQGKRYGSV